MSADSAAALARRLVDASGGTVRAVLLYGSHLLRTAPDRHSAVDLVVVVDAYHPFYRALARAGELPRPASLMTALAHMLPPNVVSFAPDEGRDGLAKCLVVDGAHLERALRPRPWDHFLLARLVQRVALLWARSDEDARWTTDLLEEAHHGVLEWTAPYLDDRPFDARSLGRRLLEVCYRAELRPEARDRAGEIYEAQAEHFERALGPVLERARIAGVLAAVPGGGYRLARPMGFRERVWWRRYFRRSKMRATARWLKHTITFANWLPYVVRKVERHTGRPVRLTVLERRLPLIFLWPRAIRVLLQRPARRGSGVAGPDRETTP